MQHAECHRGEVGNFTSRQIIGATQETTAYKRKREETNKEGFTRTFSEEDRNKPFSEDDWKQQLAIFRTTLLMCVWSAPHHAHLQITKDDLDSYYDDWILGKRILKSTHKPTLASMIIMERKAWNEIVQHIHDDEMTLKQAITETKNDTLFWGEELQYKPNTKGHEKGKAGKHTNSTWDYNNQSTYSKGGKPYKGGKDGKGKGKSGKGKGKGKDGKGKSGKGTNNSTWGNTAKTVKYDRTKMTILMPNGKYSCRNFHQNNSCSGGCGRSHSCPYFDGTTTCNASPGKCPHYMG